MRIQFLYWQECPSYEDALTRLKKVLREERIDCEIEQIIITSDDQAGILNFSGSPTVLINGRDIDPDGAQKQCSALTCRIYKLPDGRISPLPSEEMIRNAIRNEK